MLSMKQIRYDIGRIDQSMFDDKGYLKADAYATRTGVFTYVMPDGSVRRELRKPEEVFSKESMDSLANVVITNNHPPVPLDSVNTKAYACGFTGKEVKIDGIFISVDTIITDASLIAEILEGKEELSCGYGCEVVEESGVFNGEAYDAIQTNIRYNHLSVVNKGRAGPQVKMKMDSEGNEMNVAIMRNDSDEDAEKKVGAKNTNDVPLRGQDTKKGSEMSKITVDGVEFESSESLATVVCAKIKELENLKKDHAELVSVKEKLEGKLDGLQVESEKQAKQIEELKNDKMSDAEILKRADELNKIKKVSESVLGEELKADSFDLNEVKKKVVAKLKPELDIESKSDDYIDGLFDFISENHADQKEDPLKEAFKNKNDSSGKFDYKQARLDSQREAIESFQNYKGV